MEKFPIALTAAMVASVTFMAGCGQGSKAGSGSRVDGLASLSVDLVDAPVDSAANVFIRVKGMTLHSPDGEDIRFQYCADTNEQDSGEIPVENPDEVDGGTTEIPTDSESQEPVSVPEEATEDNSDVTPITEEEVESLPQNPDLDAVMDETLADVCEEPEIREIDLLALTDGKSKRLLDNISVPVGDYPWIRLEIDEDQPGYIVLDDGATHDLTIPGAANTGLKLVSGFSVEPGGENQILIDFDLRKSVHKAGSNYRLKPALRLLKIDNVAKQRLHGEWLAESMGQCESPMAYIYEGEDVVPDDIGGSGAQPLITTAFVADEDGTRSTYRVDYIGYGDYTVAFTCNGEIDSAESDDDVVFVQSTNVTVVE